MAEQNGNGLFARGTLRGIRERKIKTDTGDFIKTTAVLDRGDGYDLYVSQNGEGGSKMKADLSGHVGETVTLSVYAGNYREIRYLSLIKVG